MNGWSDIVGGLIGAAITASAGLAALPWAIRKLKAEATSTEISSAVAEQAGDDAHWTALFDKQKDMLKDQKDMLDAVRADVAAHSAEIEKLKQANEQIRTMYWHAIVHIRSTNAWIERHGDMGEWKDSRPLPPADIADDI